MFLILIYSYLFLFLTFLHFLLRKLSQVLRALLIRITMHHSRERSLSSQRNIKVGIFRSWFWPIFSHFISPFFLCHSLFSPFLCHSMSVSFSRFRCHSLSLSLSLSRFLLFVFLSSFLSFVEWTSYSKSVIEFFHYLFSEPYFSSLIDFLLENLDEKNPIFSLL